MFTEEINAELDKLTKSNNYRGIAGLLKDYIEILLAIMLSIVAENIIMYILIVLFIGTRQRALATILHDSSHRVLAKNLTVNDILGKYLSGYLIFQSFSTYVKSHVINHHNYLGDDERDPDYKMYIESGVFSSRNKKELIVKHFVNPILLSKSPTFLYYLFKNRFGSFKSNESKVIIVYWAFILLLAYHFTLLNLVFLYWFIPFVTAFPVVGWFIELSEHYPIIKNNSDMYQTRNRFGNKLEQYLTGVHNENYHLTHHLRADIPYWNIGKAHKVMMQDKEYNRINKSFGGMITTSSVSQQSIISDILSYHTNREENR